MHKQNLDDTIWKSPPAIKISKSHQDNELFSERLADRKIVGEKEASENISLPTSNVLNILRNVDDTKKIQIIEPLKALIVKF